MMRMPVSPQRFLVRVVWFEGALALVQLLHLSLLTVSQPRDLVAWLFVHAVAQASLWAMRQGARHSTTFPPIPWKLLVGLLLFTGAMKLYSRTGYVGSWLAEGLQATRADEDLFDTAGSSYVNIFFYPLAILLAFTTMPRRAYRIALLAVLIVCLVDMVAIGTRNAPVFVLMFHALLVPTRLRARHTITIALVMSAFVGLFSYSTVNRTQDSVAGTFDWLELFTFTRSSEVLRIDNEVAAPIADAVPAALPAIFLAHYLTHSVAELAHLVNIDGLRTGDAYHTIYQVCVVKLCSQADAFEGIEATNPRAGVYQTIWGSLILDFGIVGALFAWTVTLFAVCLWQRLRRGELTVALAVGAPIIALGQIENYLYNGLGLVQITCMFALVALFRPFAARAPRPRRPRTPQPLTPAAATP